MEVKIRELELDSPLETPLLLELETYPFFPPHRIFLVPGSMASCSAPNCGVPIMAVAAAPCAQCFCTEHCKGCTLPCMFHKSPAPNQRRAEQTTTCGNEPPHQLLSQTCRCSICSQLVTTMPQGLLRGLLLQQQGRLQQHARRVCRQIRTPRDRLPGLLLQQ